MPDVWVGPLSFPVGLDVLHRRHAMGPGAVESAWTDPLTAASSSGLESRDGAQLSTPREHRSACQRLSQPNRSAPK